MDTLYAAKKWSNLRFVEILLYISAVWALLMSQSFLFNTPLFADDLRFATATLAPVGLSIEQIKYEMETQYSTEAQEQKFNENIRKKYPNSLIKTVDKGIKHIKLTRYYDGRPVRINVVEINTKLASDFGIRPALSSNGNTIKSKRTITTIAKNSNSVAAINGTFFKPQNGIPLGTLMINGKIYTGPVYDRVAMGIFDDGFDMARVQFNSTIKAGNTTVKIDNINQPRMLSSYVLAYTQDWGTIAPASPKYGYQIAIQGNKITASSYSSLEIPENGYVIVGPEKLLKPLTSEKRVNVELGTTPEWSGVKHIISGGPYLVKNSEVFVDMTAQRLGAIGGKNPRTAIGYTKDNNLIMVTVDGREGSSVGMTLKQLAYFMKSIGCTNAMNLDGGGSTVMYVDGTVVNKPQVKGGINISNALVVARKG